MTTRGFALFETAIGHCGIAWGDAGIVGVQLPMDDPALTHARLKQRFADLDEATPPTKVRAVQRAVVALLSGNARDLSGIRLDTRKLPPFRRSVYDAARQIPPGSTCSYGELAQRIGSPGAARAVGQALGHNPFPIIVPCHRVLAAGGRIGGFTATGGVATKRRMLAIERALSDATQPSLPDAPAGVLDFDPKRAVPAQWSLGRRRTDTTTDRARLNREAAKCRVVPREGTVARGPRATQPRRRDSIARRHAPTAG
jgi:methylated-DNA-[protein]-cysteine S-methyltransferase